MGELQCRNNERDQLKNPDGAARVVKMLGLHCARARPYAPIEHATLVGRPWAIAVGEKRSSAIGAQRSSSHMIPVTAMDLVWTELRVEVTTTGRHLVASLYLETNILQLLIRCTTFCFLLGCV